MRLKGHATIELTDVNTGEKIVHEDDNMITNAIANLLGFSGVFNNNSGGYSALYKPTDKFSPLKRLTGGLLLFDSQLDEDPDLIYSPAGVSLVGCASGISYNGANTMAGSYNKSESGKIDGGYKHVWDFGTSQANGQIACACLTTMSGGKTTSGSYPFSTDYTYKSGDSTDVVEEVLFTGQRNDVYMSKCEDETYPSYNTSNAILFLDGKRNRLLKATSIYWGRAYYSNNTKEQEYFQKSIFFNKAIDIVIERLGATTFSIFDSPSNQRLAQSEAYDERTIETVHVEMPEGLKAVITDDMINNYGRYFGVSTSCDENFIYIAIKLATTSTSNYVIEKNGKFYVWKINVETFESTYFEVTNTTNEQIRFQSSRMSGLMTYDCVTEICMFDDWLLCSGYSSKKVYCINLNDNTDVAEIKYPNGSDFLANASYFLGICIYQKGRMILHTNGSAAANFLNIVDPVTKIVSCKNINPSYFWEAGAYYNYTRKVMPIAGTIFLAYFYADSSHCRLTSFIDPALLITINNLSSPVLKTESQTMKVTYTLTQVVDE